MARLLGVGGVQLKVAPFDLEATWQRAARLVGQLTATWRWIDLVVLPELSLHAVASFAEATPRDWMERVAEPIPGPTTERLGALAKRRGVWLVPGSLYERDGDAIHNTAVVLNPEGELVASYRKLFPWTPYERVTPGREPCVFEMPGTGTIGLCICYDIWFPEVTRSLALRGAEAILHPSLTATWDRHLEQVLARAAAISNQAYLLDVNGVGELGGGQSVFVGPDGDQLHQAGAAEEVFARQLDLDAVRRTREDGTLGLNRLAEWWPRAAELRLTDPGPAAQVEGRAEQPEPRRSP
jgi:formamidase